MLTMVAARSMPVHLGNCSTHCPQQSRHGSCRTAYHQHIKRRWHSELYRSEAAANHVTTISSDTSLVVALFKTFGSRYGTTALEKRCMLLPILRQAEVLPCGQDELQPKAHACISCLKHSQWQQWQFVWSTFQPPPMVQVLGDVKGWPCSALESASGNSASDSQQACPFINAFDFDASEHVN